MSRRKKDKLQEKEAGLPEELSREEIERYLVQTAGELNLRLLCGIETEGSKSRIDIALPPERMLWVEEIILTEYVPSQKKTAAERICGYRKWFISCLIELFQKIWSAFKKNKKEKER